MAEYHELADIAVRILHQFPSIYPCKTAFSTMSVIKTKYINHLDIQTPLPVALSSVEPDSIN